MRKSTMIQNDLEFKSLSKKTKRTK